MQATANESFPEYRPRDPTEGEHSLPQFPAEKHVGVKDASEERNRGRVKG